MMRIPDEHFSVIVLGNHGSIKAQQLAQKTADIYFGDAPGAAGKQMDTPGPVELDEKQLLEKVGRYYDGESGSFVDVDLHDGQLQLWGYNVLPKSENSFIFAISPEASADFTQETEDEPRGLSIDTGLSRQRFVLVEKINTTGDYLVDFEGSYYSQELDVSWKILREGDDLVVHRRRQGLSRLNPVTRDVFSDDWMASITHSNIKPLTMVFKRGQNQAPSGFRISDSGGSVKNLRFVKVES
jgi:hypothetical protein